MTTIETQNAGSLHALVRRWRRWRRAWMALRNPSRFAEWVNSERASLQICNDPSGRWTVQIGSLVMPSHGPTLGEAMCHQFLMLDARAEWSWTSDYLRSPNSGLSDK